MNNIEIYDITSHLGNNLVAAAKILAGRNYRENEDFNYSFDDSHTSCYIDTVNKTISMKEIDIEEPEEGCPICGNPMCSEECEDMQEPDYDWLAEVANGR